MSILVTGGAGYIATHTIYYLLEKGEKVVAVDNFNNACPEAIDRVKELTGKDFPLYEQDVCDEEAMVKIMSENDVECVIHFAGHKAVG